MRLQRFRKIRCPTHFSFVGSGFLVQKSVRPNLMSRPGGGYGAIRGSGCLLAIMSRVMTQSGSSSSSGFTERVHARRTGCSRAQARRHGRSLRFTGDSESLSHSVTDGTVAEAAARAGKGLLASKLAPRLPSQPQRYRDCQWPATRPAAAAAPAGARRPRRAAT